MKYSDATEQSESNEEATNSATLELECAWFELVLKIALSPYVSEDDEPTLQNPYAIPPPDLSNDPSPYAERILGGAYPGYEPFLSGALAVSGEYLKRFTVGGNHKPDYNINFPAKQVETQLSWTYHHWPRPAQGNCSGDAEGGENPVRAFPCHPSNFYIFIKRQDASLHQTKTTDPLNSTRKPSCHLLPDLLICIPAPCKHHHHHLSPLYLLYPM